jgi:hypothetical protein
LAANKFENWGLGVLSDTYLGSGCRSELGIKL